MEFHFSVFQLELGTVTSDDDSYAYYYYAYSSPGGVA